MPSLVSPTSPSLASASASKSYAPLADEVNPPFGNIAPAPTVTRNGTIVYGKRADSSSTVSSGSGSGSGGSGSASVSRSGSLGRGGGGSGRSSPDPPSIVMRGLRSESEETLNPARAKLAARETGHRSDDGEHPFEGDMGQIQRVEGMGLGTGSGYGLREGKVDYKGKGKDKAWDLEQGRVEEVYGVSGRYPPTNEEEEEEKRVQENLARMAARDMARRRASRLSRQIPTSPTIDAGSTQRQASVSANTAGKRSSLMGLVGGIWSGRGVNGSERIDEDNEGEVPLQRTSISPSSMPDPYANPYDPPQVSTVPKMVISPARSPTEHRNPFTDPSTSPASVDPDAKPSSNGYFYTPTATSTHRRQQSTSSDIVSPSEAGFTYGGPGWRGGGAVAGAAAQGSQGGRVEQAPEKWWHSLCAWGKDLDGGHGEDVDGQAGRTNPFE